MCRGWHRCFANDCVADDGAENAASNPEMRYAKVNEAWVTQGMGEAICHVPADKSIASGQACAITHLRSFSDVARPIKAVG